MLYLLTASWEWFAAALFIGLAVGFATTTRDRSVTFSGHGAVVAAAFIVAGGFLVANLQTVPGRAGLGLEIALLIVAAYGVGLPIGGGAKLAFGAAAPAAPAKKKPPLVVVKGKPREETAPTIAAAPEALASPPPPPPAPEPAPPAKAAPIAVPPPAAAVAPAPRAKAAPAAEAAGKKIPGHRPAGLPQPRDGASDDLTKIKGVGPKSVEKLHALGVYHFDQIAAWTPENVKYVSASLAIPGRIEKGRWIAQAKELAGPGRAATEPDHVSAQAK